MSIVLKSRIRSQKHHGRCPAELFELSQVQAVAYSCRCSFGSRLLGGGHCRSDFLWRLYAGVGQDERNDSVGRHRIFYSERSIVILGRVCGERKDIHGGNQ